MAWVYLGIASLFEVVWAVGMKLSEGFTHLWYSVGTVVGMVASFAFLALALRQLPLGTAYAAWTGIGAVGTVVVGILAFGEPRDLPRVLCIMAILAGVVGLKVTAGH